MVGAAHEHAKHPIIGSIEESKDMDKLTVAELMSSLETHEKLLERH